jgi:hypothetical protein
VLDKIKAYIQRGNELGLPIPVVRDPSTGKGSISATLLVVSSIMLIASLVTAKVNNSGAMEFHALSLATYLGRKYQSKAGTSLDTK